ncbi:MAG: penicillin-binding transpeptidase domain-containing protein [Myxococcota bacterium]
MTLSLALQAAAVYAVAWLLARFGTPGHRRAVLIAGCVGVALLPMLPSFPSWVPPSPTPGALLGTFEILQEPAGVGPTVHSASRPITSVPLWWGIWMVGLCLSLIQLGLDVRSVWRLWASAEHLEGNVGTSPHVNTPVAVGILGPRILLPPSSTNWSEAKRGLVLAHERAHVRYHDNLVMLLCRAVACVHWFNPLAWWTLRSLRDACEHHADDVVLRDGVAPTDYADALIAVARDRTPALGLAMARSSALERRVHAVLAPRRRGHVWGPMGGVFLVLTFALGTVTCSDPVATTPTPTPSSSMWEARLEAEAERLMVDVQPDGLALVVLDARSGRVLGQAERGDLLNRSISPASLIKPFIAVAALESGTPSDHPFEDGDMASILARSSNSGAQEIARHVGPTPIQDVLERVGLVGATAPPVERLALGDGVWATPVTLAQAWQHLSGHGRIAPSVATTARELLAGVVEEGGTGRLAHIPDTPIAGKTGSARMIGPDGAPIEGRYIASFAGLVPAADPELVIVVCVEGPRTDQPWGGRVAAPVFRRIVQTR